MQYKDVLDLINSTLHGRESGQEILPLEHQDMITAVLEYAHQTEVDGQSILQGFAYSNTVPVTPDDGKVCYISICPSNQTTTYLSFSDEKGTPISITCNENQAKFVVLLWNTSYWEKMVQAFNVRIGRVIDGGKANGEVVR